MTAFTKEDALELWRKTREAYDLAHPHINAKADQAAATVLHDRINEIVEARLAEVRAERDRWSSEHDRMADLLGEAHYTIAEQRDQLKDARHAMAKQSATIAEQAAVIEKLREAASPALTALEHSLQSWPDVERKLRAALQKDQTNG